MVRKFNYKPRLTLPVQSIHISRLFPNWNCEIVKNRLICIGELQPTPLSDTYLVSLEYVIGEKPDARIIQPELVKPDEKKLPHVFTGDKLCLYYRDEWKPDMIIATTIIPWISEWILFYELWLATGDWLGGGIHPSDVKTKNLTKTCKDSHKIRKRRKI